MYPQQKQLQAITAIKEALVQPEQKPVAWRYLTRYPSQNVWTYCGSEPETKPEREPLYTTPPQRTWVGLTDEDKHYLNEVLNLQGRFPVIDAIEAKLKEKNNG